MSPVTGVFLILLLCCTAVNSGESDSVDKGEKSGQCPSLPPGNILIKCPFWNTTTCVNDTDCKGHQKCCKEICTKKCRDPVGEKSGQCPSLPHGNILIKCPFLNTTTCVNDMDCKGHQKCCKEICTNKCMDPVDKQGSCPIPPERCFKAPRLDGICTKDYQCPGDLKCCVHACEYACIEPVKREKSGQCPSLPPGKILIKCPFWNTTTCVNDMDCKGHQKCCKEICTNKCMDPVAEKHGQCPSLPYGIIPYECPFFNKTTCVNDADCKGHQKCCRELCRNECRDPVEKPGTCPADVDYPTCKDSMLSFKDDCKVDQDCDGKSKCCFSGCRRRCLLPLGVKNGVCPYFNNTKCMLIKPEPYECENDNQCQGTYRCCNYGCRNQCMPTEKVKPGECPIPITRCAFTPPPPLCHSDSDCDGKRKCCIRVCKKECVNPKP